MSKKLIGLIGFCLMTFSALSENYELKGIVKDRDNEPLIGATVLLVESHQGAMAGFDGSYRIDDIEAGDYTVRVSYIGYKTQVHQLKIKHDNVMEFVLDFNDQIVGEVVVTSTRKQNTISSARSTEKLSPKVVNVVSAKAIELSPDLNIAEVIQRISGVSLEYSGSGTGAYAIVRGMDKRYNYTLVNGVKIPSPDNKNRYVPLDMFPSEMVDRVEVSKALTPDMEGDAVGGVMDMKMKNAPNEMHINANLSTGMNTLFWDKSFEGYDFSAVNHSTPRYTYGDDYRATAADFTTKNLIKNPYTYPVDYNASLSLGNRFFNKKMGVMIAGSYQQLHRGSTTGFYKHSMRIDGSNLTLLDNYNERDYSSQQIRSGAHAKVDYTFNTRHSISLYSAYIYQREEQLRENIKFRVYDGGFDPETRSGTATLETRFRPQEQSILNTTLQGKHHFIYDQLIFDWSAVYSNAMGNTPDQTIFTRNTAFRDGEMTQVRVEDYGSQFRRWEDNSDRDYTGYANLTYKIQHHELKVGGMYRDKFRDNRYINYNFKPLSDEIREGKDWSYDEVEWEVTSPRGGVTSELNYDAYEKITAAYLQFNVQLNTKTKLYGGVRLEDTRQGYELRNPKMNQEPTSEQHYSDILPSIHLRYSITENSNLRASYFKSIIRPGFFEIVPYEIKGVEDYDELGNPDLKRTRAHNIDVRYELFPTPQDNVFFGVFYKRLNDPIEYALAFLEGLSKGPYLRPGNYGEATNMGFEMDVTRYFNQFGIKANYTYTNSEITTSKSVYERKDADDETSDIVPVLYDQTRPLQGQASHIGNVTLLYKNQPLGLDLQLANVFTGERISEVSAFLNKDLWEKPTWKMDFSVEKTFGSNITCFAKLRNILNTKRKIVVKENINAHDSKYPFQGLEGDDILIRNDEYGQNFLIGFRYKF